MKAVADGFVSFPIWLDRQILDINPLNVDLQAATPGDATLVVNEGRPQYAPEPSADCADISQLPSTFKRPERKAM